MPSQRWSIFLPQVSCVSIFIRGSPHFRQSGTLFQAHYFYFCHFDFPNFPWMCSVTVQPRGRQSSIFSNNILNVNQNLHVLVALQNLSELHKHYFLHILLTEKSNDRKVKWYAVLLHVITSENLGHPFPAHTISAGIGGVFFFPASSGNSVTHCVSHSYAEWCPVLPGHVHNKTFAPLFSWNGFGITKSSLVLPVFECFKPVFPSFWRKYHKTDTTRKYYKTDSMIYMHTSEVLGRHFQKHKC